MTQRFATRCVYFHPTLENEKWTTNNTFKDQMWAGIRL
jgi:hypothetical protein